MSHNNNEVDQDIYELPGAWEWVALGNICNPLNGRAFKSSEWRDSGVPIIRIQNLKNADAAFNYFQGDLDDKHKVIAGNLLFAWSGTPGTSFGAHIWHGPDAALNQHIFNVKFDHDVIDPKYFCYALNQNVTRYVEQAQGGVGLAHITKSKFMASKIPLAPVVHQKRIVAEIEKQFSRLDEAVANLKRVKANLKRYKAAVLKAAVEGTIVGHDCSTWEATSLGAVATTVRNGFSGKPDAEAGTRIFRISAVRSLKLDLDDVRYLSGEIVDYSLSFVSAGDVLFTRYNGNPELVGVCAVVPRGCPETVHPDKLIRVVTPKEILLPEMLALLATAGEGRSFIKSKTRTTAGQAGISGGDLKALPIRIPPLNIQHKIVAEVERRLSLVAEAEAQIEVNLRRADRLRQSILKQAFSGQLVPQEPSDEPASVLLARMRETQPAQVEESAARRCRNRTLAPKTGALFPELSPMVGSPRHLR